MIRQAFSDTQLTMNPVFNRTEPVNYLWKSLVLTESRLAAQKVDLSESYSLAEALAHFSSDLNFVERLEVLKQVQESQKIDFSEYFKVLGQHFDIGLHGQILEALYFWPQSFVEWSKAKDLNPKDFRIFLKDKSEELDGLLSKVGELQPTKMNGLKIIDLSLDLLAHRKVNLEKIKSFKNDQALLTFLKKTRFSETLKRDQEENHRFSKIDLAKDTKISTLRSGDQNQIHLEIKSSTPEDLIKKMDRVQKKISEIQKAWLGES